MKNSLWRAGYHPSRPFLLLKGVYLLLTADLFLEMVEHGGRYGVGGFNVGHFAWLDRLLPLPTPPLYVGLLIASGLVAAQLSVGAAPRWLRLLLAALYTLSWAMSLHDSYQHHYLISWLLVWCAACPDLRAAEAADPPSSTVQGWGLPMTAITCAIVYGFTGVSKSEEEWRSGRVLEVLTRARPPGASDPGKFDAARDLLMQIGLDESAVWRLFALSTIALQWLIAAAYLAAPRRDERPSRLRLALVTLGLLGAFSFHLTAELFHIFEIGLFSYYMLWIATVLLAPVALLRPLVAAWAQLAQSIRKLEAELAAWLERRPRPAWYWPVLLALLLLVATVGWAVPLPGARGAAWVGAAIAVVRLAAVAYRHRHKASPAVELAMSTTFSALIAWAALSLTSVPFDYYRRTAGELRRMGQAERALEQYRLAERYAPRGHSRAKAIRELEAELK